MAYIKISNFIQHDGKADYKGLDLKKNVSGSQIYPENENVAYLIYNGDLVQHGDIEVITETEYQQALDTHDNIVTPEERIEQLENETADLWYEKMLDEARISEHDSEIAELWYEMMLGGVA